MPKIIHFKADIFLATFQSVHNVQLKLAEIATYRDILCRQVDVLQAFYEAANEMQANRLSMCVSSANVYLMLS